MIVGATASWAGYKANDWFSVDLEMAKPLFYQSPSGNLVAIPGVRGLLEAQKLGTAGKVVVHRTHLPLLTSPEALRLLTQVKSSGWEARDRWAADRGFKPRITQHQAIDFIDGRRGTLLGDDLRLGKTISCLMSHDPARGPLVVAAPLSTRAVWLGWMRRCFPELPIGILTGKKKIGKELLERPIVFCHYDILRHWQSAMKIGTFVLEEAHLACNRKTDRARAAAVFSSRAEKMIAVTGTPIWNMPPDLWNVIGMLTPAAWGSYWDFGMRYGDPYRTGYGLEFRGSTNAEELRARLSEIKIRRLWSEVRDDLPPISRNIVVSDIDEPTSRKLDILAAKLKKERTNAAANLALYRSQLCKVKLKTVVREARSIMQSGEPVVIWTWHKEFAEAIANELGQTCLAPPEDPRAWLIHGNIQTDEREARMDAWRARPNDALVATMAVAQVGIDLSHAHLAIFAELDYVPATIGQTEMRTYSPDRPMNITFIVVNHVVDQRIVRSLVGKLNAADPLGFGAAVEAIDALRESFEGPREDPDMDRFIDDILAAGFEVT